ncbi:MAG: hypothetical protein AB7E36_05080 [Salinivirgaceae bacterium]
MKKILTLGLILIAFVAMSQDKIVKLSGEEIACIVTEIASAEVKYYYEKNPKIIFGIDKALIDRIEFSTGEVIKIEGNTFNDAAYYSNQNKKALKINFLSPLMGSTEIVYEQNYQPGQSWEIALGIVGLGIDNQEINPKGAYTKFAYKFIRTPDYYMQRMHYSHILKGAYFAPELAFRYVKYDRRNYDYWYSDGTKTATDEFAFAFTLKFGKQWVFNDTFIVDTYFGLGYGMGKNNYDVLNYGFIAGDDDLPMAVTAGLRIGWAF